MNHMKSRGVAVVCELTLSIPEIFGTEMTHDLEGFKAGRGDLVANRYGKKSADVASKTHASDLLKSIRTNY